MTHKVSISFVNDIVKAIGFEINDEKLGDDILDAMISGILKFEKFSEMEKFPIPCGIMGMIFDGDDDPHFQIIKKVFLLDRVMNDDYYGLSTLNLDFDKEGRLKPGKYPNCYIFESLDAFDGIPSDFLESINYEYVPTNKSTSYELGKIIFKKIMFESRLMPIIIRLITNGNLYKNVSKQLYKENYLEKVKRT